jgi:hypothetical protein
MPKPTQQNHRSNGDGDGIPELSSQKDKIEIRYEPPRGEEAAGVGGRLSARAWEEEAEERQMRQREVEVDLRWRRARVAAEGARALVSARRDLVRVEEEGLRLAEELSEDRLLVALETLELAEARQAAEGQSGRSRLSGPKSSGEPQV